MPIAGCTTNGDTYIGAAPVGVSGEPWRLAQLSHVGRSCLHLSETTLLLALLVEAVPRSFTSLAELGLLSASCYIWHMP